MSDFLALALLAYMGWGWWLWYRSLRRSSENLKLTLVLLPIALLIGPFVVVAINIRERVTNTVLVHYSYMDRETGKQRFESVWVPKPDLHWADFPPAANALHPVDTEIQNAGEEKIQNSLPFAANTA